MQKNCLTVDLGLIGYAEAYALQKRIVTARKADAIEDVLLLCEHPHVITQGRNGKREHLLASEHVLRQKGVEFYETSRGGDITIGEDCWIGANCIISPGVTIGKGAVVGANSVVTGDVPEYAIVAGSPARPIGQRE